MSLIKIVDVCYIMHIPNYRRSHNLRSRLLSFWSFWMAVIHSTDYWFECTDDSRCHLLLPVAWKNPFLFCLNGSNTLLFLIKSQQRLQSIPTDFFLMAKCGTGCLLTSFVCQQHYISVFQNDFVHIFYVFWSDCWILVNRAFDIIGVHMTFFF